MIHSKDELLDYVIRYMAENSLEMNHYEQMKFACFADWLQKQNFCKPDVSSSADIDDKPLTQCMVGRDTECNHPKCPVTDEDVANGRYCTLPLYDWRT